MSASPEPLPVTWRGTRAAGWARRWWRGEAVPGGRIASAALAPAEALFRGAAAARRRLYRAGLLPRCEPALPIVSVGNLRVGGTGKTPVTRWVAARLVDLGARPAIVHGGYAADEPALLRLWMPDIPVLARRDRCAAVAEAQGRGATVAVLDDAFQHLRVPRALDIVLVAAEHWTVRPRLLPRGPWREGPAALGRADIVVVTRKTAPAEEAERVGAEVARVAPGAALARVRLEARGWRRLGARAEDQTSTGPAGPVLLVAAIAEPELFLEGARRAGALVEEALFYPDHHAYTSEDGEEIARRAGGRAVVVTEKDAVKLSGQLGVREVWALLQSVVPEAGEEALMGRLREVAE